MRIIVAKTKKIDFLHHPRIKSTVCDANTVLFYVNPFMNVCVDMRKA